jgi:ribonuclease Z
MESFVLSNKTPSLRRQLTPSLTLVGHSRAAWSTVFWIPQLDIQFDAGGFLQHSPPKYLFLTHSHADHSVTVPRQKSKHCPPSVYAPSEITGLLEKHNLVAEQFQYSDETHVPLKGANVIGVVPEQEFLILNDTVSVLVIKCYHSVPCVGFGLSKRVKRLLPEFQNKTGQELGQLRKLGTTLDEYITVPMILYLGDTDIRVMSDPRIFTFPIVIVECTFLHVDELERATMTQHIHYRHLAPYLLQYPEVTFILIHFSLRYTEEEIHTFFKDQNHQNVILWI